MRWSQAVIPTFKQTPADSPSVGHALLARAGLIHLSRKSRSVSILPLGMRSLSKLENLARKALEAPAGLGFQEAILAHASLDSPPMEVAGSAFRSYRQLPKQLFQIVREPSPGLIGFGFHANDRELRDAGERFVSAIAGVLSLCKINFTPVTLFAGKSLAVLSTTGESSILISPSGDYAATIDAAETAPRQGNFAGEPKVDLEKIHTPDLKTVSEVCRFLDLSPKQILKTLVFAAQSPIAIRWVVAVVRGDHQVNIHKLTEAAAAMGVTSLRLAEMEEARGRWCMGFVGPDATMKLPDAVLIVDPDAAQGEIAWSAGGNEPDTHVRSFNWFRECGDRLADPVKVTVAHIRNAVEGDGSPTGSGPMKLDRATILAEYRSAPTASEATFDDAAGKPQPFHVAAYRVALLETLLAAAAISHDEHGLTWPSSICPYSVAITPILYEAEVRDAADSLYQRLSADGIDVILDDRDLRAGVKFADADLVGFPFRITIGSKTLASGEVELKARTSPQSERVELEAVTAKLSQALLGY
jgi:prolyl-tRNA synthetase